MKRKKQSRTKRPKPLPEAQGSGAASRFTDTEIEEARRISNDISEAIDNGEPRHQLRMAVAYWADEACYEAQRRAAAESQIKIFMLAKGMMDAALPTNSD